MGAPSRVSAALLPGMEMHAPPKQRVSFRAAAPLALAAPPIAAAGDPVGEAHRQKLYTLYEELERAKQ